MKNLTTTIALVSSVFITTSCLKARNPSIQSKRDGGSSRMTSVDMKLPKSDVFKPSSGNAVVNAFRLSVKPVDDTCEKATVIDETKSYTNNRLDYKLVKGCDYLVVLALGELAKDDSKKFTAYYQNEKELTVDKSELESSPVAIKPRLALTAAGAKSKMPASPNTGDADADRPDTDKPDKPDTDKPDSGVPDDDTPKEIPDTGIPSLADKLKVNLAKGGGKTIKFEEYFTTEYMIIDFSQVGCGPCVSHAQEISNDATFKKMTDGSGKCKSMILVSESQIGGWESVVGASTFAGKSSFGYSGGLNGFSQLFGIPRITSTPTVIMVDRQGKVVSNNARSTSSIQSMCQ
jgi:hypothetical protein